MMQMFKKIPSKQRKKNISKTNKLKRLALHKVYVGKPPEFGKISLFSDNTKFNIFSSESKKTVWQSPSNIKLEIAVKHILL